MKTRLKRLAVEVNYHMIERACVGLPCVLNANKQHQLLLSDLDLLLDLKKLHV